MRTSSRWIRGAGVACAVFGLTSCTDTLVTEVEPGEAVRPAFANGGRGGGGGGGGGGSGPASGNVATAFADAPGDAVFSDDGTAYVTIKKQSQVTSEVDQAGRHNLQVNEGSGRSLCVAFPAAADTTWSQTDLDDFLDVSGIQLGGDPYCGIVTFHTAAHSDPDRLLAMSAGDVQTAGGKLVLKEFDGGQSWQWRLFFDDSRGSQTSDTNGLCIAYDGNVWTLGTDPSIDDASSAPNTCDEAGVDEYLDLVRVTSVYTPVARFRLPFSYTVQRVN